MQTPTLPVEDVQSYPRPAVAEAIAYSVTVTLGGETIAKTMQAIRVLETHHAPTYYIPRHDISAQLVPVGGPSFCEWKGVARYFDVVGGSQRATRAAWTYEDPAQAFLTLVDHLAFYAGKMDRCTVAGVEVLPQHGDFYGGWRTPNLRGIVKGRPGTEHW